MEYDQQIRVKLTKEQLAEVKIAAMRIGLPVSVYARFAMVEKAKKENEPHK